MNTLQIGSTVIRGWTAYSVIAEMREGFIARSHVGKYVFLYGYGLPVGKYVERAMINIYLHRGYTNIKRFWSVV